MFTDSILFEKLEERSHEKAELIRRVYEKFKDEIEAITVLFSEYTDHGIDHCKSVIEILEELVIGKDLLKNSKWEKVWGSWRLKIKDDAYLTEDEITLLLLAILLHDIGMSPKIDGRLKELFDKVKLGEVKRDEIEEIKRIVRETHHIRSREFVENNSDLKELMQKYRFDKYVKALAEIVEGHRIDPCDLFSRFRKVYDVRVPLLAFLLEIADDMDIGSHRVDMFVSEDWIWLYLSKDNIKHILANMSVEKRYRDGDRVEYVTSITDIEKYGFILELIYRWWDKIEDRINRFGLVGMFGEREDVTAWRYVLPSKVEFKIKAEGIDADWSKKFEVDRRIFADLLSSRVYEDDWRFAFRELITNAFDAIKVRAYEDGSFDNPKVKIDVRFKGDWVEIVIEDNGIGMNLRDVEDYLLKVGRSLYREISERREISSAGYYGIGFLSSFMLLRNNGEFEGSIEVESKKKGYDAVKVLILNPNLPVVRFRSDRDEIGTVVRIKCRNKKVKEFFEYFLKLVKICKENGIDIRAFPEFGVINSVFDVRGKRLEIPIVFRVEGEEIWNGSIEPKLFVDGQLIEEVEVRDETGYYRLEIWKGLFKFVEVLTENVLTEIISEETVFDVKEGINIFIPTDRLIDLVEIAESVIEEIFGIKKYVLISGESKLELSVQSKRSITNDNGILCDMENKDYLYVFLESSSSTDEEPLTIILNVDSRNLDYLNLEKTEVKISRKVLGKLFRKLKDKKITLYLISRKLYIEVEDRDFEEIGAIDFVKSCLKFEDLYGNFLTLDEIEKAGREPVIVDIGFIKAFKDEYKTLWNRYNLHPLDPKYLNFLTTCQKVSNIFFEECEECKNCILDGGIRIKNSDLRDLCLKKDTFITGVIEKVLVLFYSGSYTPTIINHKNNYLVLDNPFAEAICEMWYNGKIARDKFKLFIKLLDEIVNRKGYVTVKDVEEIANKDDKIREIYEQIRRWMESQNHQK